MTIVFTLENIYLTGNVQISLAFFALNGNIPSGTSTLYTINLTPGQIINVNQTFTGSFTIPTGYTISLFFFQDTFSTVPLAVRVDIEKG